MTHTQAHNNTTTRQHNKRPIIAYGLVLQQDEGVEIVRTGANRHGEEEMDGFKFELWQRTLLLC